MGKITAKNIVFITGAFVTNACWDEWRIYFEHKGYTTYAPAWPFKDGTAAELRSRQPDDVDLATLTLSKLIDHYVAFIKSLPGKPIVIGHSLGGLITQVIVNKGLADAAVAIHSVPTLGVFPYEFPFLKIAWKSLGLFTPRKKTYLMSFKDWRDIFVNEMSLEEQNVAYQKFTIPESKTVVRGGLTHTAKVEYKKEHVPILFTSGSIDNVVPAHINYRNFKKYKTSTSVRHYKEFSGHNHFVLGQPGWERKAAYILNWLRLT